MKKIIYLLTIIYVAGINARAQQNDGLLCFNSDIKRSSCVRVTQPEKIQYRKQSFYRHIDFESGNIFSLAAFSLVGGLLNNAVQDKLYRNAFLFTPVKAKANSTDLDIENYKWNQINAGDLFKDIQIGGGLGWQSQRGAFNAGFFASLHYKINQFKVEDKFQNASLKHNVQRIIPGINAVFTIGDLTGDGVRTYIEAGLRYAVAVNYQNPYNLKTKDLNNGLVTHFAVYVAPNPDFLLQDIGFFVNINHYNLIKDKTVSNSAVSELKMWTLGIQFSISRDQAAGR